MGDKKIFDSLFGAGLGPLPAPGPDGLPAKVKEVIAADREKTEAVQSSETELQRIERQKREHYIDLYYRQGGGNGTRK